MQYELQLRDIGSFSIKNTLQMISPINETKKLHDDLIGPLDNLELVTNSATRRLTAKLSIYSVDKQIIDKKSFWSWLV